MCISSARARVGVQFRLCLGSFCCMFMHFLIHLGAFVDNQLTVCCVCVFFSWEMNMVIVRSSWLVAVGSCPCVRRMMMIYL